MSDPALDALLTNMREGGSVFGDSIAEARAGFDEMFGGMPIAPDLSFESITLGSVGGLKATTPNSHPDRALLYLHGGAYVIGSANGYRGLAGELARASGATGYVIDYRLAPEHPFPAAVEDALEAYRALLDMGLTAAQITVAGDSAGGGLTMALLLAIREKGLPQPAAALTISPWVDLRASGDSIRTKQAADPSLTGDGLREMAALYLAGAAGNAPLASPVHGDLADLAPVLIQVGSAEILLDDAVLLARQLGMANSAVTLEIVPHVPHVWHAFHFMLPQGADAIVRAGAFLASHFKA
jgi:acetyl esterase/lipase